MKEQIGLPLSLGEARLVARQIRDAVGGPDRHYWPWVIETLIARCESSEALLRRLVAAEAAAVDHHAGPFPVAAVAVANEGREFLARNP